MPLDPVEIRRALDHLRAADPIMRGVIERAGPFTLKPRRDRFHALVGSIISQQISGKAAKAIHARLKAHLAPERITAETLLRIRVSELRKAGLSAQKATYLKDLASRVADRSLRLDRIAQLPDEEIIESLVQVKGVGVWTAQMFLIFSLGRLDVFPHADLGIRVALRNLYGLNELPDQEKSHKIAASWRPYATIGTWYCWRSLDFKPAIS